MDDSDLRTFRGTDNPGLVSAIKMRVDKRVHRDERPFVSKLGGWVVPKALEVEFKHLNADKQTESVDAQLPTDQQPELQCVFNSDFWADHQIQRGVFHPVDEWVMRLVIVNLGTAYLKAKRHILHKLIPFDLVPHLFEYEP